MSRLKNPRWEAFAQAVATGMSASAAYRATYGTNSKQVDSLSCRLSVKVSKRVIEIQAQAEHQTHLTITEKRSMLAKESRDLRNKLRDRISAMDMDSKLAGHIKQAESGGVNVNVNVAMLTEDRRKELIARKRASIERKLQRAIAPPAPTITLNGNGNGTNGHHN